EISLDCRLQAGDGMDSRAFDRLIARASDPRLIPGVYNYCDARCPRCPFTTRCLVYVDNKESNPQEVGAALADAVCASLRRTIVMVAGIAPRDTVDSSEIADEPAVPASQVDLAQHRQDPLIVRSEDYTRLAWSVSRAIAPVVAARGEPSVIDAVATIQWFSLRVSSKLFRAVVGRMEGWEPDEQVQTDFNGSAKMA